MPKITKKSIAKRTKEVGSQLFDVLEALNDLDYMVDYGPELDDEEMGKLTLLSHVRNLVNIAFEIYPYSVA